MTGRRSGAAGSVPADGTPRRGSGRPKGWHPSKTYARCEGTVGCTNAIATPDGFCERCEDERVADYR